MNFEKVPDSSYSGINTKAGQQLLIPVKPIGNMATANMPDTIYITLVSEQILSNSIETPECRFWIKKVQKGLKTSRFMLLYNGRQISKRKNICC